MYIFLKISFKRTIYMYAYPVTLHISCLFQVVKQLRFIKFMHIYEKTISTAVGQLLAVGLIFIILLLIYAQVGYLVSYCPLLIILLPLYTHIYEKKISMTVGQLAVGLILIILLLMH